MLGKTLGCVEKAQPVILRERSDRRISLIHMKILRFAQNDTLIFPVFNSTFSLVSEHKPEGSEWILKFDLRI